MRAGEQVRRQQLPGPRSAFGRLRACSTALSCSTDLLFNPSGAQTKPEKKPCGENVFWPFHCLRQMARVGNCLSVAEMRYSLSAANFSIGIMISVFIRA